MVLMSNLARIGDTPVVCLPQLFGENLTIYTKIEAGNPAGSVKDRIAFSMIEDAMEKGLLTQKGCIVEPTSGNTGIGLAMVAAKYGIRLVLTMPETMSVERRRLMRAYGAELVLTPASEGMVGAIARAHEIVKANAGAYMPDQFSNPANPLAHERHTGPEVVKVIKGLEIDAFVFLVGTGGTLTGIGRALRKHGIEAPIIAVEPAASPVIAGGKPGPHKIQGIGAGFVPANLDTNLLSEVVPVENEEAFEYARKLASQEGILVGISSGAAVAACIKYAKSFPDRHLRLFTLFPDTGERYLSTELFAND